MLHFSHYEEHTLKILLFLRLYNNAAALNVPANGFICWTDCVRLRCRAMTQFSIKSCESNSDMRTEADILNVKCKLGTDALCLSRVIRGLGGRLFPLYQSEEEP